MCEEQHGSHYGCISMSEERMRGNKVKKDKGVQDVWSLGALYEFWLS